MGIQIHEFPMGISGPRATTAASLSLESKHARQRIIRLNNASMSRSRLPNILLIHCRSRCVRLLWKEEVVSVVVGKPELTRLTALQAKEHCVFQGRVHWLC